jgi:hypothetical protein
LGGVKAAFDQIRQQAVATVAFSVDPSQSPSGIFTPSLVTPSATMLVRPFKSMPSSIRTARRTSAKRRAISSESASWVRSMKVREIADLLIPRATCSTSSPIGSPVRR